jgi:uncharacterized membrane protein YjfL (UPF0719 family)
LPKELTESDNPAVGLTLSGFLVGIGLSLVGAVYGLQDNPSDALLSVGVALLVCVPLLRISGIIHDKFLLYQFSIAKEIKEDRNLGTGAVCCGGFIGTGLILMSSFIGEGPGWLAFFLSLLSAYVLGQAIFILGGIFFQKATSYDLHYEIGERDNVSAGIIFGSFLVGLGLVVSASIVNLNLRDSFLVDLEHRKQLQNKEVSESLRKEFTEHHILLSSATTVDIQTKEKRWTLQDSENKTQYVITRENESLQVYTGVNWKSFLIQLLFASIVGIIGILVLLGMGIVSAMLVFPGVSLSDEVRQKNPAVSLVIASVYLTVGLITFTLLKK